MMRLCTLLCTLAACSGDGSEPGPPDVDDPCSPPGEPTLRIGLGMAAVGYEPLEEGDSVPLIHGPQGGFHVEVGLHATHLAAESWLAGEILGFVEGEELAASYPRLDLRCGPDGRKSFGTLLVYNSTPDFLDGKSTTIRATVTDDEGTAVTTESTFIIEDTE